MKNLKFQLLLLLFGGILFLFPDLCIEGAKSGLLLWSGTIVPTLLPFLLLTGLMNKFHALHLLSFLFYPIYRRFPSLNKNLAYTMVLGFFCGYPLGAKIIRDLILCGSYTKKEGQCLLAVCNNVSPMFTIGYTLHLILKDEVRTSLFFFCLYAPNIVYFLFHAIRLYRQGFFREHPVMPVISAQKTMDEIIFDSLRSIFSIGIYIMIFSIGANLLISIPSTPSVISLLIGCLEITTGITHFGTLPLPFPVKSAAICAISAFGGFCSAAQTAAVSGDSHLSILHYLGTKAVFSFVSGCLALIFL